MAIASLDDARTQYLANVEYTTSTTAARAFIAACRALLLLLPSRGRIAGVDAEFRVESVAQQLAQAETWLAAQAELGRPGSVRHIDLSGYRS
jgi:hypothetical protein